MQLVCQMTNCIAQTPLQAFILYAHLKVEALL